MEFHNQHVEDHRLPSYDPSTWSSYQATKSQTQISSSGMSAFADPKETTIATSKDNENMILDEEENDSDGSDEPEPYNAREGFRGELDVVPHTKHSLGINELAHNGNHNAMKIMDHMSDRIHHSEI